MMDVLGAIWWFVINVFLMIFVSGFWITWAILGGSIVVYVVLRFVRKDQFAFERAFLTGVAALLVELIFQVLNHWDKLGRM